MPTDLADVATDVADAAAGGVELPLEAAAGIAALGRAASGLGEALREALDAVLEIIVRNDLE